MIARRTSKEPLVLGPYIGIMEKKMETIGIIRVTLGIY